MNLLQYHVAKCVVLTCVEIYSRKISVEVRNRLLNPWSSNLWLKSSHLNIICEYRYYFLLFFVFRDLGRQFWFYDFLMVFLTYQVDTSEQTFLIVQNILTNQFCCRGGGEKTHFFPPLQLEKWQFQEIFPGPCRNTFSYISFFKSAVVYH